MRWKLWLVAIAGCNGKDDTSAPDTGRDADTDTDTDSDTDSDADTDTAASAGVYTGPVHIDFAFGALTVSYGSCDGTMTLTTGDTVTGSAQCELATDLSLTLELTGGPALEGVAQMPFYMDGTVMQGTWQASEDVSGAITGTSTGEHLWSASYFSWTANFTVTP